MKTQVIHLESYDDRHSIIDRLNWGQAEKVILNWPVRGNPVESKLDLKLIQRRCQEESVQLALVCKSRQVIDHADELGIPVFRSLRQAQRSPWKMGAPEENRPSPPKKKYTREELADLIQQSSQPAWTQEKSVRLIAFALSILAVLVLTAYILPGATIEFQPPSETQTLELTLTANPAVESYNLSGVVPSERLSITVEGRAERTPSGEIGIPDQHATGIIVFTNLTNDEVTIPIGTLIRTADPNNPIRFATSIQSTTTPEAGTTIRIPIEAVNPGTNGNLPANSLVIIEGELSRSLTAVNPERTTGGTEYTSTAPTAEDYEALSQELLDSLWQTAQEEAALTLEDKDILLHSEPRKVTILEETFLPEEPQPSSVLTLLLRVEYEILAIRWEDLSAMGNATLDATIPSGFRPQAQTLAVFADQSPVIDDSDIATWDVTLSRQIFAVESLSQSIRMVLGKSPQRAKALLQESLDLSTQPSLTLFPDWWPLMPLNAFRIQTVDLIQGQ
ncbi:MAG: baseplate J/gp47 family protein [Anaerolineales bacterium]